MSEDKPIHDKPIHVQVAEALGWAGLEPTRGGAHWWGVSPGYPADTHRVPDYTTDWSATGQLVEKYGIGLAPTHREWYAAWPNGTGINGSETVEAPTPLLAICALIIELGKAGKL